MLNGDHVAAAGFLHEAIRLSPTWYATAQENLARNRRMSIHGPVADAGPSPDKTVDPPSQEAPGETDAEATDDVDTELLFERRWVAVPWLRVREGGSLEAPVLDRLSEGRVVRVVRVDGDWAQIIYWLDRGGSVLEQSGWVYHRFLTDRRESHAS